MLQPGVPKREFTYQKTLYSLITPKSVTPLPLPNDSDEDLTPQELSRRALSRVRSSLNKLYPLFKELNPEVELVCKSKRDNGQITNSVANNEQDDPEDISWIEELLPPVIHVAGTKGKGSTCMFCESVLRKSGLRTAVYTSPHLISLTERLKIDGKNIEEEKFQFYVDKVHGYLSENGNAIDLGFFRFMTVLCLYIVASESRKMVPNGIDVLILEVGLGGLLDSTNVLTSRSKAVCGVTLLDYDHTDFLGETIEEIAAQKAGIFIADVPSFTISTQLPNAMEVLKETATRNGSILKVTDPEKFDDICKEFDEKLKLKQLSLGIEGEHQIHNARLALSLCNSLLQSRFDKNLSIDAVLKGLQEVSFAGRCQKVPDDEFDNLTWFFDGAHTAKSMRAAVKWFSSNIDLKRDRNLLVFNCAHTKKVKDLMMEIINADLVFDGVYFVVPYSFKPSSNPLPSVDEIVNGSLGSDRSVKGDCIWQRLECEAWKKLCILSSKQIDVDQCSWGMKIDDALNYIKQNDLPAVQKSGHVNVFVTGSLLLVGDALKSVNQC